MDREISPRPKQLKRMLVIVLFTATAIALLIAFRSLIRPSIDLKEVRTAQVIRGDLSASISASGLLEPLDASVIVSQVQGRLEQVIHLNGDAVSKGDTIMTISTPEQLSSLQQLQDRIRMKQSSRQAKQLESQIALAQLASSIELKQVDRQAVDAAFNRQKELHSQGLASKSQVEESEIAARKAEIELKQLKLSLGRNEKLFAAQLDALDAELDSMKEDQRQIQATIDSSHVVADRAGVLTFALSEPGQIIDKGTLLARIADLTQFRVVASLSDFYASQIKRGLPATIDVNGHILQGSVAQVLPEILDGAQKLLITLDDPSHGSLHASLRVSVSIITQTLANTLKVKSGPFFVGAGQNDVFRLESNFATRMQVQLGLANRHEIQVIEGLSEGDHIIISDMARYQHLQRLPLKTPRGVNP